MKLVLIEAEVTDCEILGQIILPQGADNPPPPFFTNQLQNMGTK
jgi:hypothetical protein